MRVKIFRGADSEKLEEEIDGWLANNVYTRIYNITQSQDAGTESEVGIVVICVWYEEE